MLSHSFINFAKTISALTKEDIEFAVIYDKNIERIEIIIDITNDKILFKSIGTVHVVYKVVDDTIVVFDQAVRYDRLFIEDMNNLTNAIINVKDNDCASIYYHKSTNTDNKPSTIDDALNAIKKYCV